MQRGHQHTRFRVALERLAVARLVKHYGRNAKAFPLPARDIYASRIHDRLKRELQQADLFFRKLFPSLSGERMLCRPRA